MEDMVKRKGRKRRLPLGLGSGQKRKLLLEMPLNVLSAEVPQLLTPKEALQLALTCKDLKHVAKGYPRKVIQEKLHHFAKLSYSPRIGLIALDYAYSKVCGVCKREFSGAFSRRFPGLYAHDHCIGNEVVSLLYVREEYGLLESDLPTEMPVIAKFSREHTGMRGDYPFGKKCIWRNCHEMVPLRWTFEWVLHHDATLREKIHCRSIALKRQFALASMPEFRKPLFAGGVVYPTHVHFARTLTAKPSFLSLMRGHCSASESEDRVRQVVARGLALLSRVEKELVVLGPLLVEDGIGCCDPSMDSLEKALGHTLWSYLNVSYSGDSIVIDKLIERWKTKLWNDLRVARIEKLEHDPMLKWIVELRFEEFTEDYLRVWQPASTCQDIRCRALRLQRSPEFRNSELKFYSPLEIRSAFSNYLKKQKKFHLLPVEVKIEKLKFLHIQDREKLTTTQRALVLLGRIRKHLAEEDPQHQLA